MNHSFEIAVDGQTRETWDEVVAQFSDANIYQTWAYGAVRWGGKSLSHMVLHRGRDLVAAAQLRIIRLPFVRAGIAYLRWGPMCQMQNSALDPSVTREMIECLKREYSYRRRLCLQIIPNAFNGGDGGKIYEEAFSLSGFSADGSLRPYRTVLVDLSHTPEVMRKQLNQKWRNQLNRSEKNGLEFEVSETTTAYEEFLGLYKEMRVRKQFKTSVDVKEFEKIQDYLSSRSKMHVFIARKDGESIAALVESHIGNTAIYLLGATNPKGRELKAAYFLQWQAILFQRQRGALHYDLGGVDLDSNPGGYHFKSGFGGEVVTQLDIRACPGGLMSRGAVTLLAVWRRR